MPTQKGPAGPKTGRGQRLGRQPDLTLTSSGLHVVHTCTKTTCTSSSADFNLCPLTGISRNREYNESFQQSIKPMGRLGAPTLTSGIRSGVGLGGNGLSNLTPRWAGAQLAQGGRGKEARGPERWSCGGGGRGREVRQQGRQPGARLRVSGSAAPPGRPRAAHP